MRRISTPFFNLITRFCDIFGASISCELGQIIRMPTIARQPSNSSDIGAWIEIVSPCETSMRLQKKKLENLPRLEASTFPLHAYCDQLILRVCLPVVSSVNHWLHEWLMVLWFFFDNYPCHVFTRIVCSSASFVSSCDQLKPCAERCRFVSSNMGTIFTWLSWIGGRERESSSSSTPSSLTMRRELLAAAASVSESLTRSDWNLLDLRFTDALFPKTKDLTKWRGMFATSGRRNSAAVLSAESNCLPSKQHEILSGHHSLVNPNLCHQKCDSTIHRISS